MSTVPKLFFGRDPLGHYSSRLWQSFAHSATAAPFFVVRTSHAASAAPDFPLLPIASYRVVQNEPSPIEGHFWPTLYVFSRFYILAESLVDVPSGQRRSRRKPHISIVFLSLLFHHATKGTPATRVYKRYGGGLLQKMDFRRDYFRRVTLYCKRGRWQI